MAKPQTWEMNISVFSPDFEPDMPQWRKVASEEDQDDEVFTVHDFVQGMFNRTGVSYHKYGSISDNFPHIRTGIANAAVRLERYCETGNVEELIDAANYLLIEAMRPSHPEAHFRPTDSDESPGALNLDGSVSHGRD